MEGTRSATSGDEVGAVVGRRSPSAVGGADRRASARAVVGPPTCVAGPAGERVDAGEALLSARRSGPPPEMTLSPALPFSVSAGVPAVTFSMDDSGSVPSPTVFCAVVPRRATRSRRRRRSGLGGRVGAGAAGTACRSGRHRSAYRCCRRGAGRWRENRWGVWWCRRPGFRWRPADPAGGRRSLGRRGFPFWGAGRVRRPPGSARRVAGRPRYPRRRRWRSSPCRCRCRRRACRRRPHRSARRCCPRHPTACRWRHRRSACRSACAAGQAVVVAAARHRVVAARSGQRVGEVGAYEVLD